MGPGKLGSAFLLCLPSFLEVWGDPLPSGRGQHIRFGRNNTQIRDPLLLTKETTT